MTSPDIAFEKMWRNYQRKLKRGSRRKYILYRLPLLCLYGVLSFLILSAAVLSGSWILPHLNAGLPVPTMAVQEKEPFRLLRSDLPEILGPINPSRFEDVTSFTVGEGESELLVETTLDPSLQAYVANLLGRSLTHQAAVVVMNPVDGRILAMVSYSGGKSDPEENLCIRSDFPAASLIKIVAAAAAIEAKGFRPEKVLTYRGRRYSLYQNQLQNMIETGPHAHEITLRRAFGTSINPVFGKLGIFHLGENLLDHYARRFLFNEPIPLELPLPPSFIEVPSHDFGLAEIASGFNRETLISPVHASMIASAVANRGIMMSPWMIRRIRDAQGEQIYLASIEPLATPISEATASEMMGLMEDTMLHGTARESFGTFRNKKGFEEMAIGGKTGSIRDQTRRYRLDWLSAYAIPNDGRQPISITVLALHDEKLGIRSRSLARYILEYYYRS